MRRHTWLSAALLAAALLSGCAASRAFQRAEEFGSHGDWDSAVAYYRRAMQADPNKPEYKIALERAMLQASRQHLDRARELEQRDELGGAVLEYRKAVEFDPSNSQAAMRVNQLEVMLRDRLEAQRPKPPIEEMQARARRQTEPPLLNPASREPLSLRFTNASTQDILNFIGNATGINVIYDRDFRPQPFTIQLDGVTLEEALGQIMATNQLWYKVLNERTILVIPDNAAKRQLLEDQVVRTFYISHADPQELAQMLTQVLRFQGGVVPFVSANKNTNTITVRGTNAIVNIMERVIQSNDKPRAEVVVDVEILEVNRSRAKQYGLSLSDYSISAIFSPEHPPTTSTDTAVQRTTTQPFNLNTITQGISTSDFYLTVPSAVVRFLESDSQTKIIAKPQLRGAEGQKLTLNLGDEVPVPSTVFTPFAAGGVSANPLTSFQYRNVGVNVEMTPRVTFENEIILEITVENSSLGQNILVAGSLLPTFGTRKVGTKLRLREGESNLLAGLLREEDRRSLRGFPGLLRLPIFKQLASDNDISASQTDIVMLLTPRIVRTHQLTQENLNPIYIGSQQNVGLTGPPQLIAPPAEAAPAPPAPPPPGEVAPRIPSGSSPIPGTTTLPPAPVPPPAEPAPAPEPAPAAPAPTEPAPAATQILVTTPGTEFRVGGGPYTVPISIAGASRLSIVSVSLTFNPATVRVQSVQEGSFMRQGGMQVTFTQQVDAGVGRVDITITRVGDATGASGAGLLAAVLFAAVGAGQTPLEISGVATAADGSSVPLQFAPATVAVR